jgi:hypothetical protein
LAPWVREADCLELEMPSKQQKLPPGLGAAGRKLWREIVAPLAEEDFELTSRERQWLQSACNLRDRVVELEAVMAVSEPVVKGVAGQPVAHPLLIEIRQHHQLIAQLLARLDLSTDEEDTAASIPVSSPALRSVKARAAAQKRWRGSA